MPLKMLGMIILLVIITVFAGLNLDNKCNINLIFRQFKDVPIFFSLLLSFLCGMIFMLPYALGKRHRDSRKHNADEKKMNSPRDRTFHE